MYVIIRILCVRGERATTHNMFEKDLCELHVQARETFL